MHPVSRHILVTGASSGIGRAVARGLLAQGHYVYGVSRNVDQFGKHSRFTGLSMDMADLEALPDSAGRWLRQYHQIDALALCAGYGQFGTLEQFSYPQIRRLMDVNFTAQAMLSRCFVPSLRKKTGADIIFIGSEAALQGRRKGAIYCASKFALRGFAQALREECASSGVKVALINPGMVKTEFFNDLNFKPGDQAENFLEPGDVAAAVSYVLASSATIVIDEINLNPLNKVVSFK